MYIHCVGIDLAWQPHNPSAITELIFYKKSGIITFLKTVVVKNHLELISFLRTTERLPNLTLAIDAPLTSHSKPFRELDKELLRFLIPYKVGVLPLINLEISALLKFFKSSGYSLYPIPYDGNKGVHEVYPQLISIGLTGEKLPYKSRRGISSKSGKSSVAQYLRKITYILEVHFKLKGFNILEEKIVDSPLRVCIDMMDSLLCAISSLWVHSDLKLKTIPKDPTPGAPFIITPWLTGT